MKRLTMLFGFGLVAALVFEATIRVEDWVRFGMPLWSPVRNLSDLVVRDSEGVHGRANAQWRKWRMNNVGTRGRDVDPQRPAETTRIVVLGASETFGLYESPEQEYPRQLEDSLRVGLSSSCVAPVQRVEVLNAAAPGMSLPTFTRYLRRHLGQLRPDLVVVYPTPGQYLDVSAPRDGPPNPNAKDLMKPIWGAYPRGIEQLRNGVKSMLPGPIATWLRNRDIELARSRRTDVARFDTLPGERLASFDADLRKLVGTIRAIGAAPVLMTHGNRFPEGKPVDQGELTAWRRFYPFASGSVILAFDSAGAAATARIAADSSAILVDLRETLPAERDLLFADFVHFTDRGAGFVAHHLATQLRQRIPCRLGG